MTTQKHLKERVRARMARTGESYTSARRHVVHDRAKSSKHPWHFSGRVPAATALRSLLTAAGVGDPLTGEPLSEPMVYGLAGGIGMGIFTFCYEKEDFASFFIAGRHLWHDDAAYFDKALARFGIQPKVREASSPKAAEKALREALADGPCIAWVDMAGLPHRAMPAKWSGGGYHVVTAYSIDDDGNVQIGDLADKPIAIEGPAFAAARGRIKKFKHRLLSIPKADGPKNLTPLVRDALRACHGGLMGEGGPKNVKVNFSLRAIGAWADRLGAAGGRESWAEVFRRGQRLWGGLTSIHQFIEHWSGGGLGRPLFARFLIEAGNATGDSRLHILAKGYADIGRDWSELADAALPKQVREFREARDLYSRMAELVATGGKLDEMRAAWDRLDALGQQARKEFPLSVAECESLRTDLQRRVRALADKETAAHAELGRIIGS
jgi:hypothetical protein